jgi:hypothetical protein
MDGSRARLLSFWVDEVDVRPLCLFRIAFAAALILWYLEVLPDAGAFLSTEGVFPLGSVGFYGSVRGFSLLDGVDTASQSTVFLLAAIAIAACLLAGIHTRLAAVLNFVFFTSVHQRNLIVFYRGGVDVFFALISFWLIFAPIERAFSIDARSAAARGRPLSTRAEAFPLRLLILEVAIVYAASFLEKLASPAWRDGTALYYALHTEHMYARSLGRSLADVTWFTRAATYATLAFEGAFLPIAFSPVGQPRARRALVVVGLGFHAGIALLMKIGWWSYILPIAYLCLVDGPWLERLGLLRPAAPPPPRTSPEPRRGLRRLERPALLFVFALSASYAFGVLDPRSVTARALEYAGLEQRWPMFVVPPPFDGHLRVDATLADGRTIDLQRPYYDSVYASRWDGVSWAVEHNPECARCYAEWTARTYEGARAPESPRLTRVAVVWRRRDTQLPGAPPLPWEERTLSELRFP